MKKIILLLLCALLIFSASACKKAPPSMDSSATPSESSSPEQLVQTPATPPPTPSEQTPEPTEYERFSEILPGQWTCYEPMMSDITCLLDISVDGKFIAEFTEFDGDNTIASHAGRIAEQWMTSEVETDLPDILSFDIIGDPYVPGGDYRFDLTLHNGDYVLTFYQASNGDGIFTEHFSYGPIFFYKPAPDAVSTAAPPRKAQTFEAVFWGIDNEQRLIWLEHSNVLTSSSLKREITESTQYTMAPDITYDLYHTNDLYQAVLYTVTTNASGEVTHFAPFGILDSEPLYHDYMDSRAWQESPDEYDRDAPFTEFPIEISAYKIIDFDRDGTDELWFCAYDTSSVMPQGFSVFCTITDGEVRPVVHCYLTGGTIGGDEVFALYDTESDKHVIVVRSYSAGWGGFFDQADIYDYNSGTLTLITALSISREDSDSDEVFEIDDAEVTKEQYEAACGRFADPTDEDFVFYFH